MSTSSQPVVLVTGARKGIGRHLAEHYATRGMRVFGCSREPTDYTHQNYRHSCLDVCDEPKVKRLMTDIRKDAGRLDVLINNAGVASMNAALLTPLTTVQRILNTNVVGTFLFCREAAKLMMIKKYGRIVNFTTVATPLRLEGEAIYAASKAAVITLTQVLAREFAPFNITVNAIGPTPIDTDLIRSVPAQKISELLRRQAIPRKGELGDVTNAIDFFIRPESNFVTGQVLFLGGI
jgi:3-oxoacyl-[acyl-carrier protein] reductase